MHEDPTSLSLLNVLLEEERKRSENINDNKHDDQWSAAKTVNQNGVKFLLKVSQIMGLLYASALVFVFMIEDEDYDNDYLKNTTKTYVDGYLGNKSSLQMGKSSRHISDIRY